MAGFWDGLGNILGKGASGAGNLLSGLFGKGMSGGTGAGQLTASQLGQQNSPMFGLGKGLSSMFGGASGMGGLGLMGIGSMLPNPGIPKMPGAFDEYMRMAGQGGPPLTQSSNQYMQSILSGTNTAATDAATRSLDWSDEQRKRELISMYKSLRPGTDPSTDSTYQRDLAQLEQQSAQNRADVLSRQQQGAAQYGMQQGNQQMGWQAQGVDAMVNQIATQWQMNYNQRQALREQLMGLGNNMMDPSTALLKKLMGR